MHGRGLETSKSPHPRRLLLSKPSATGVGRALEAKALQNVPDSQLCGRHSVRSQSVISRAWKMVRAFRPNFPQIRMSAATGFSRPLRRQRFPVFVTGVPAEVCPWPGFLGPSASGSNILRSAVRLQRLRLQSVRNFQRLRLERKLSHGWQGPLVAMWLANSLSSRPRNLNLVLPRDVF